MAGDRDSILKKVTDALAPLPKRAAMPKYDSALELTRTRVDSGDPVVEFMARMRAVNGEVVASPAALAELLKLKGWRRGYCDPVLWPLLGPVLGQDFHVEQVFDRTRVDDYQFGITRAGGCHRGDGHRSS
jgi:L-lactate dehydrogenase complex protein LldG